MALASVARLRVLSVFLSTGCGGMPLYVPAPKWESSEDIETAESDAFKFLSSKEGPPRFARVAEHLYRGGQPAKGDLAQLKELGVTTIINLRREDPDVWQREEAEALRLGMKFMHFPFYGVFGADVLFLEKILTEMKKEQVYVHCKNGRDRTALMVALYRVLVEGWDPKLAWKLEVIDYGSQQTFFYRQLRVSFDRMLQTHTAPAEK